MQNNALPFDPKRTVWNYALQDGLTDIFIGIVLVMITSALHRSSFAVMLVIFLPIYVQTLKRLREKYVFPRIGYVKVKPDQKFYLITFVTVLSAAALFIVLFFAQQQESFRYLKQYTHLAFAVLLSVQFYLLSVRSGIKRYFIYIGAAVLSAAVLVFVPFEEENEPLKLFVFSFGFFLIIYGYVSFRVFIKNSPAPNDGAEHE